jgi:hypothetical protein
VNALVIVPDGAPEDEWQDGRAGGPTASKIHDIAFGSRKTWRRILDEMLNGSTFKGNEHTRRGHEWEPRIIAELSDLPGVVTVTPSSALYGNLENPKHRATPDALGLDAGGTQFGVEVKHHASNWTSTTIPVAHMDQMLWGMHVLGLDLWLYAWAVDGEDGIQHRWVVRDDDRIAFLVKQANTFIEWRAAGAPELDDIPDEVDDALTDYARGLALTSEGDALKKSARKVIDEYATTAAVEGEPLRAGGSRAALFFQPKTVQVLDEDAWAAAEPETYAEFASMRERVKATEIAAAQLYTKTKTTAPTFRVTRNGETA